MTSLHDPKFQYKVGEWIEAKEIDESDKPCAAGLHVSHATYWENQLGKAILYCKVNLDDIITVQVGKIRCRKLFVVSFRDYEVF